jgi:threonine/homoserine/homoserine lactone efflux protein
MPEANSLLLFSLAALTLNITPGPDMLYIIARSAGQGRAAGVVSALGIAAGCAVHTLLVACGLAGLLLTVPVAYDVIKYSGAAYLIYLGVRTLTSCRKLKVDAQPYRSSLRSVFFQGMLTNVLNPKVALFFLAFLPQFIGQSRGGIVLQIIILGLLFNILGTTVNIIVSLAASMTGGHFMSRLGDSSGFRRLTGCVLIGLGVRLAFLERR